MITQQQILEIITEYGDTREAVDQIVSLSGLPLRAAGDLIIPHITKMKPIYKISTGEISGYALTNRRVSSTRQFCVTLETLGMFDTPHECYDYLTEGFNAGLLPRSGGGEGRPLTPRAIELYGRNRAAGFKRWQWFQLQNKAVYNSTGYHSVWGYGYRDGTDVYIVNDDDSIEFKVEGDA